MLIILILLKFKKKNNKLYIKNIFKFIKLRKFF